MDARRLRRRRRYTMNVWTTWTSGRVECWKPHRKDQDLSFRQSPGTSSNESAPGTVFGSRITNRTGATQLLTDFLSLRSSSMLVPCQKEIIMDRWWRRGVVVNALVVINEVTLRRVRLVLGWVTVYGRVNHLGM